MVRRYKRDKILKFAGAGYKIRMQASTGRENYNKCFYVNFDH